MKTLRFLENTSNALFIISTGMILIGFVGVLTGCTSPILLGVLGLATFLSIAAAVIDCCVYNIKTKILKKEESEYWNRLISNAEREEDEEAFIQKKLEVIRRARKEKY